MFTSLEDLTTRVLQLVAHHAGDEAVEQALVQDECTAAVADYSRHYPRVVYELLSGDGSKILFPLSSFTVSWVDGFSVIQKIEHPTGDNPRTYLDESRYELVPDNEAPTDIEFISAPVTGTNNVRVVHTGMHSVTNATTPVQTIPDNHEGGVEYLAACRVARVQSATFGHSVDPTIEADSSNSIGRTDAWEKIADMFCRKANEALGISGGGDGAKVKAAGGKMDYDTKPYPFGSYIYRDKTVA